MAMFRPRIVLLAALCAMPFALAGCASFSPDGGMGSVSASVQDATGAVAVKISDDASADTARNRISALMAKPLTPLAATQIALLGNRGLQAAYNDLGISEAQFVQASLPPSPTISLSRMAGGLEVEIERQILVSLLGLLTLPARKEIAAAKYEQARLRAVEETLKLIVQTRRAWYRAVASRQTERSLAAAANNARIIAQLLRKLGESGAVNKLDQAREHAFYAETSAQLARARMTATADREALARLMGAWGQSAKFRLPASLPRLPARAIARPEIERQAIERNVQIALARAELDVTAKTLGLTETTRMIDVLEVRGIDTAIRKTVIENGVPVKERETKRGLEVELRVPLFDFGQARTREAEETWKRSVNRLADTAINVRSHAREAYARYRGSFDLARHYQRNVLPLRKMITDENMLRYNAMLVDIMPVLADARQRIVSQMSAIDAQRDFWIAYSDMIAAVIGGGLGEGASSPRAAAAAGGGAEAGGH